MDLTKALGKIKITALINIVILISFLLIIIPNFILENQSNLVTSLFNIIIYFIYFSIAMRAELKLNKSPKEYLIIISITNILHLMYLTDFNVYLLISTITSIIAIKLININDKLTKA